MAFNDKEQAIIRAGQQAGKSGAEIKQAVLNSRLGIKPSQQPVAQPEQGFLGQVADAAKSGVSRIEQGFEQAQVGTPNPVNALESGIKVAEGAIQTATSPLAPLFSPLGKIIGYVSDKISNIPGVQDFASSKAGEVTSRVAEDVAGLSTIAGTVAGFRGAPRVGTTLSNVAKETSASLQGITDTGITGIQKASSQALDPAKIMQRVARIPAGAQAKFQKITGKGVGQYLVDEGIFGTVDEITTQLFDKFQKSRMTADDALSRLDERFPQTYKPTPVGTALDELLSRETRVSTVGAKSKDFNRVRELKNKYQKDGLTMSEINEIKRIYERNVRVDYLKSINPEGVARATNLDSAIREWQFAQADKLGLKNLPDINKQTQAAKQLLDDLGKAHAAQAGNNAVTLTDWIILSELDPTAIGSFLAKKTLGSKGVQSEIAKRLAGKPTPTDSFPIFENIGEAIDSFGEWSKSIETRK